MGKASVEDSTRRDAPRYKGPKFIGVCPSARDFEKTELRLRVNGVDHDPHTVGPWKNYHG